MMTVSGAWLRTDCFGVWRLLAVSGTTQYALLVVQARNDNDDCIGNTLGKLTRFVKNV